MNKPHHATHADLARLAFEMDAIADAAGIAQSENESEFWRLCRVYFDKMEAFWDCSDCLMRTRHAHQ